MKISIINGPNLNLLGMREPEKYGDLSFEDYLKDLKGKYSKLELDYYQSNVEGELINEIHRVGFEYDGLIINAGGYTHTSVAIGDAIAAISSPCIELHITNVYSREEFRHHSYLSANCQAVISGLGLHGYQLAIDYFLLNQK